MRVAMIDGEPWFVGQDVCVLLFGERVKDAGVTQFMRHIDTTERRMVPRSTMSQSQGTRKGSGGNPSITVISESGLYKLIMRSDKPEAKAFQDWVGKNPAHIFDAQR